MLNASLNKTFLSFRPLSLSLTLTHTMCLSIYLYVYMSVCISVCLLVRLRDRWKEGNVLFNDTLNTFYLRLYGVGHMVKDHYKLLHRKPIAAATLVTILFGTRNCSMGPLFSNLRRMLILLFLFLLQFELS